MESTVGVGAAKSAAGAWAKMSVMVFVKYIVDVMVVVDLGGRRGVIYNSLQSTLRMSYWSLG
jgi:hypothetical protein